VIVKQPLLKSEILKTYFDILFYKDLLERYKIENEVVMKFLIKRLILNNTKQINLLKIYNQLKSQGIKVSKNTIYEYFTYLKNIFYIDELVNFYKKQSKTYLFNF
jgi:predicted AAA+ superfamily ATPase